MSAIRGKDTKPEVSLRAACWRLGLRYRLGVKIVGRPDFAFPKEKVAVFIDGCFWHGCPQHYRAPETRSGFWRQKIDRNIIRDAEVTATLRADDWVVVRVWEHALDNPASLQGQAKSIQQIVLKRRISNV